MVKTKKKTPPKEKIAKKKIKVYEEEEDEEEDEENGLEEDGETEEELEANLEDAEEDVETLRFLSKKSNLNGAQEPKYATGSKVIDELKDFLDDDEEVERAIIKGSKPISQLKKGDKIKIDGNEYEVDAHYVLIDHGKTKEMTIELFDKKTDKDYQLRYFSDQVETSLEFYALEEIVYVRKPFQKIEW